MAFNRIDGHGLLSLECLLALFEIGTGASVIAALCWRICLFIAAV